VTSTHQRSGKLLLGRYSAGSSQAQITDIFLARLWLQTPPHVIGDHEVNRLGKVVGKKRKVSGIRLSIPANANPAHARRITKIGPVETPRPGAIARGECLRRSGVWLPAVNRNRTEGASDSLIGPPRLSSRTGADRPSAGQCGWAMTGLWRVPILSISTRTVSPAFRYIPGRRQAIPLGVPVASTSPTSRVKALERYDTCS